MKDKKDLSKLNLTDLDLGNTKMFINQSTVYIIDYYGLKVKAACNKTNSQQTVFKWYGRGKT